MCCSLHTHRSKSPKSIVRGPQELKLLPKQPPNDSNLRNFGLADRQSFDHRCLGHLNRTLTSKAKLTVELEAIENLL